MLDPGKRVIDFGESKKLDSGYFPSVAANSSGTVVELHAGNRLYGYSHQYYHVGQIDVKNNKIDWGSSNELPDTVSSVSEISPGACRATSSPRTSAQRSVSVQHPTILHADEERRHPDKQLDLGFGTSNSVLVIYMDPSTF